MGYNHVVFDGTGGGVILNLLAESCCTSGSAEIEQCSPVSRLLPEASLRKLVLDITSPLEGRINHSEVYCHSLAATSSTLISEESRAPQEIFIFSADKINKLKQTFNYIYPWLQDACEISTNAPLPSYVSSNDVLTALLWASIIKAGHSSRDSKQPQKGYDCVMAVNLRPFFKPRLPESYMGNAVTQLRITVDPATLPPQGAGTPHPSWDMESLSGLDIASLLPIAKLAFRIRHKLSGFNDHYVRSLTSFLKGHDDWNTMHLRPFDIVVTSWRHLQVYDLDFGPHLGYIDSFHDQWWGIPGGCVIMPAFASRSKTTGTKSEYQQPPWDVRITLDRETMANLKNDDLLCWALEGEGSNAQR
ncbi:hypothetical protein IFM53868_02448 [Aspergillus udagawae]|uniref:Uncharacterized protein n=1 Tax=Aspergillus udagawae TaxID=91492 RepID=A0ABQ1ACI3_9EURO|nr:hypothetical protein IFM53868_02448 [Aspergillus udagawae]GFG11786.1 hypothetical protein IFM5058_05618 [Aspergillus udagawae]